MKNPSLLFALLLMTSITGSFAADEQNFETPPVLAAREFAPSGVALKGTRYRVDDEVTTDGYLATFTIRSDYGRMEARGPGMLAVRIAEVGAIEQLEAMETSEIFMDALKRSASSMGAAVANVVTNTKEVAKAVPASVGRFFERAGRQVKTAAQKLDDVSKNKEPGAARGSEPSTNQANLAVAGGVAAGTAVRDILGYDEQRRHLAKQLGVDPYTTNPVLAKKLDDIAWAAFAGGLGVDLVAASVPGGRLIQSTSVISEWVYDKPPGDLKVWIEKTLRELGVDQETIDLFLRLKAFTFTTQIELVLALHRMPGVDGRVEVLDTAVTLSDEDQARFLALGMSMLALEHEKSPIAAILDGRPVGQTAEGAVVATMPVDYVSWTEKVKSFATREEWGDGRKTALIPGKLTARAREEMKKAGWDVVENTPVETTF